MNNVHSTEQKLFSKFAHRCTDRQTDKQTNKDTNLKPTLPCVIQTIFPEQELNKDYIALQENAPDHQFFMII